jgi:hypothetical protein
LLKFCQNQNNVEKMVKRILEGFEQVLKKFWLKYVGCLPGLARAVEEFWTTEREDPDSTPDEGS